MKSRCLRHVTHATKPARPTTRTGTLEVKSGRFVGRLRLGNGKKSPRFTVEAKTEVQARAMLAGLQAEEDARGIVLAATVDAERADAVDAGKAAQGETCDQWFARFHASRPHVKSREAHRWRKYVSPVIGAVPITAITADHIEDVRVSIEK
jgi:hypothetical protein